MIREGLIAAIAVVASFALLDRPGASPGFSDDFDAGIDAGWSARQEEGGRLATTAAPGRRGQALLARTDPKRGRVTKAALIARTVPMRTDETVTVDFDLYVPAATPLNSLQLVDIECATCGEAGNPGIRLYLRRGRLRVDRSKIGITHAWTRDDAPMLAHDRWQHVALTVKIGAAGAARVTLDGREVLAAQGATILPGADHADRVQIGITANSNPVPATLLIDNVAISARRPRG